MHGDSTDICRIVVACTEMELQIVKQMSVFSDYKSLFVRPVAFHEQQLSLRIYRGYTTEKQWYIHL